MTTDAQTAMPANGQPDDAARAQALAEGVEREPDSIEFAGRRFLLADKVGYMPLLKFAHYAAKGGDTGDMGAMAAMYEMLRGCFYRSPACGQCEQCLGDKTTGVNPSPIDCAMREIDEWASFEQYAIEVSADDSDLFGVVQDVVEVVTSRPTSRPSGSSPPERPTSPNSKAAQRLPPEVAGLAKIDDLARSTG